MLLDQSRQGLKNESQSVGKFACGYIQNTGGDIGEMTGYKIYKAVAGVIKPGQFREYEQPFGSLEASAHAAHTREAAAKASESAHHFAHAAFFIIFIISRLCSNCLSRRLTS